jgi:hypothetical protein
MRELMLAEVAERRYDTFWGDFRAWVVFLELGHLWRARNSDIMSDPPLPFTRSPSQLTKAEFPP